MHIEFRLPNGAGGMAAGHASSMIRKAMEQWASQNGDPIYTLGVTRPYIMKLTFEDVHYYTLFSLTWLPKAYSTGWNRITIVDE